jgi:hypothetical protein
MMPTIHGFNVLIQLTILVIFLANNRLTMATRPPPTFKPETFYCSSTDSDRVVGICVDWHAQTASSMPFFFSLPKLISFFFFWFISVDLNQELLFFFRWWHFFLKKKVGRAGHVSKYNKNVFKWCSMADKDPRRSYCCIPRVGWWADENVSHPLPQKNHYYLPTSIDRSDMV